MKINGNELKTGVILQHKNRLLLVIKTQHVKPGKGPAYMQAELKDIQDGTKIHERFRSDEALERVRLEEKNYQYLFNEDDLLTFMDQENYEQITLNKEVIGDQIDFLQENMLVTICMHDDKPVSVKLPENIIMTITESDPVIKGQTATSSYKPAVLENGVRIMVPPHIEAGTAVVVNIAERTYIERAKS